MQGASTATAEIIVFRFVADIAILVGNPIQTELVTRGNTNMVTHNAVATKKFKAEDTTARISEWRYSSASAKKGPYSRGVSFGF